LPAAGTRTLRQTPDECRGRGAAMAESGFDQAVQQSHLALAEFVKGDPEPLKAMYSRRDDVSLANPFGPPVRGWEQAAATMERAATLYREGEVVDFETVATNVTPELAYVVEVERFRAKVGRSEEVAPVALRVTSIFRPEEGTWRIVHRHADSITAARPPESVVQR
jgi:ketosteroid isomerase-like protein